MALRREIITLNLVADVLHLFLFYKFTKYIFTLYPNIDLRESIRNCTELSLLFFGYLFISFAWQLYTKSEEEKYMYI